MLEPRTESTSEQPDPCSLSRQTCLNTSMKSAEQNSPVDGRHWVISLCAMVTKPSIGIFCALLLMVRQIH